MEQRPSAQSRALSDAVVGVFGVVKGTIDRFLWPVEPTYEREGTFGRY